MKLLAMPSPFAPRPETRLDYKAAEVVLHPAGGYTLKVPVEGTYRCLYVGEYRSERQAAMALARGEYEY